MQNSEKSIARVASASILGVDAYAIEVQTKIIGSTRHFSLVGLPDGVLREAKQRVRCAIENSGFPFPHGEVVVNLAPASLPKRGAGFDLAIALSILAAAGHIPATALEHCLVYSELSLDGRLNGVGGELAVALLLAEDEMEPSHQIESHKPAMDLTPARRESLELIVALEAATTAAAVSSTRVIGASHLLEVVAHLSGRRVLTPVLCGESERQLLGEGTLVQGRPNMEQRTLSFADVIGQYAGKRALEIAAAGGHNVLLVGPPGAGKSMLAQRLPSILPPLSLAESLEVTKIHTTVRPLEGSRAIDGRASAGHVIYQRPFRAPHHTTTVQGLVGGGSVPIPGEISLAHRGVLFLDEFPEVNREALEALRMPLETKRITISRAVLRLSFPADFLLVAAMNPCPCGYAGSGGSRVCQCAPGHRQRYRAKISGPILDRIDLRVWVSPVAVSELQKSAEDESLIDPTAEIRERVSQALVVQRRRYGNDYMRNGHLQGRSLRQFCLLEPAALRLLNQAAEKMQLSARSYARVVKVARTICDLGVGQGGESAETNTAIAQQHIAEALSYRDCNL